MNESIMTPEYQQKANEIIKQSIKSAIFIDEKARDFYMLVSDDNFLEERLSQSLYTNFKEQGVSLSIDQFNLQKRKDTLYLKYLLEKRDLILLDWKLDGDSGEDYSLELLAEIVKTKNIHFCSIYTSNPNFENIIYNLISYFSNKTENELDEIREDLQNYNDIAPLINDINFDYSQNSAIIPQLLSIDSSLPNQIKAITNEPDLRKALVLVKVAFSRYHKPSIPLPKPSYINFEENTLNIDGTIISIISKDEDDYEKIITKLQNQMLSTPNHFMQLLGLDMQNIFSKSSSFIDTHVLDIDFNTVLNHRKQISGEGSEEEHTARHF